MNEIIIRKAELKDLEECEKLLDTPELIGPYGEVCSMESLKQDLIENPFFIAELSNKIVGCIIGEHLKQEGSMIWFLVVNPDYRGNSIGTLLLNKYEEQAKKDGITWIILYSDLHSNKTAEFYKKNNYKMGNKCVEFMKIL